MRLHKSTITLLRIPFSFFLMPVYFFALSQAPAVIWTKAAAVFLILHFLIYPASNGYNSFMDRDEESIGMLRHPPAATRELFYVSLLLDVIALICSFFINLVFALCIFLNILASRAYSYRGIRLKKYPVTGFLTVVLFQGAVTYLMVYAGSSPGRLLPVPWLAMLSSSFLFGGFYPLTQVYQHKQDLQDGVRSISYLLGHTGTFIFSAAMFIMAEYCLWTYFNRQAAPAHFILMQAFLLPVVVYFLYWFAKVLQNTSHADFTHSMRMNIIAAACMNACFLTLLYINHFE